MIAKAGVGSVCKAVEVDRKVKKKGEKNSFLSLANCEQVNGSEVWNELMSIWMGRGKERHI